MATDELAVCDCTRHSFCLNTHQGSGHKAMFCDLMHPRSRFSKPDRPVMFEAALWWGWSHQWTPHDADMVSPRPPPPPFLFLQSLRVILQTHQCSSKVKEMIAIINSCYHACNYNSSLGKIFNIIYLFKKNQNKRICKVTSESCQVLIF